MARYRHIQQNFLQGELSPKAFGRTDLEEYAAGAQQITNAIVQPQGGVSRRVGSEYVIDAPPGASTDIRIFPFVFSKTEPYLVIFTSNSTTIKILNVVNNLQTTATIQTSNLGATATPTSFSGYSVEDLTEVQFAQSGDLLFLVHQDHPPIYVARTSANAFELHNYYTDGTSANNYIGNKAWPFRDANTTTTTLSFSSLVQGAANTVTASTAIFNSLHIGSTWAIVDSGTVGYFSITGFTSSTIVTARNISTLPAGASGKTTWHEAAWSDHRGFPRSLTFFEQRLFYGGSDSLPDTIYASQTGDIFELTDEDTKLTLVGTVLNTDAFDFTLASPEVNLIQWMSSGSSLNIGTFGREFIVSSPDQTLSLGPLSVSAVPETTHGSSHVQAVRSQNVVNFVQRSGQKLREFVFNRDEQSYRSVELTILSEHFPKKGIDLRSAFNPGRITFMQLQEADNGIIWMLDDNNFLFGVTRDRLNGINAFHFHKFGGTFDSEDPLVTSFAVLPSSDGTHDDLYISIKRGTTASPKTTIEKLGKEYLRPSLKSTDQRSANQPIYSDSAFICKPATSVQFHASYNTASDDDADYTSSGLNTGSPTGGDVVVSGGALKLSESGAGVNYVDYDGTNLNVNTGIISGRINFSTYYSGTPVADRRICNIEEVGSANDAIIINHAATTGNLTVTINNNAGGTGVNLSYGAFSPVAGDVYELEFFKDFATSVFATMLINGKIVATGVFSGVFDTSSIDRIRIGSNAGASLDSHFAIHNFSLSTGSEHTDEYTPGPYYRNGSGEIIDLDRFEGEEIQILDGGIFKESVTVSSNKAVLTEDSTDFIVGGYEYTTEIESLDFNQGSIIGSSQAAISRIDEVTLRFHRALGARFGGRDLGDTLDSVTFRKVSDPMDEPIPLFTGDKRVLFPKGYERGSGVRVEHDQPYPMTLVCIISRGILYD